MISFYQIISGIIFKICSSGSCWSSWVIKQTYIGNFTCPQARFGHPEPLGECYVTPLVLLHRIFLIFCMILQQHKAFKLVEMVFMGKFLFWDFWAKRGQNGSKTSLLKFYKKWHSIFLIFCLKLQQHISLKLTYTGFLGKIFYWGF